MKNLILFILLSLFSIKSFALAEGVYTVIIEKQEEKKSSRWTLADWLVTKNKMALMDQWLALHSSTTWFEFIFDYGQGTIDESTSLNNVTTEIDAKRYAASMYIKFLGFEYNKYSFSKLNKQSDYKLNLLILGSSVQSTHLRAFYGKREYEYLNFSKYSQQLYGTSLSLYLADFFGTEFTYTKFSKEESENGIFSMDGQRIEYGAFIDLWFLRIYANKYIEKSIFRSTTTTHKEDDGVLVGLKLFL